MSYFRTIRFADTDAAGVVYFASLLSICHEAYEAALLRIGVDMRQFFSGSLIALPIVHAEIDFFQPLVCGDQIQISLKFEPLPASQGFHSSEEMNHHDQNHTKSQKLDKNFSEVQSQKIINLMPEQQTFSEKIANPSTHKISKFQIIYQLKNVNKAVSKSSTTIEPSPLVAQALTRHVAITLNPRRRTTIPAELYPLFKAS